MARKYEIGDWFYLDCWPEHKLYGRIGIILEKTQRWQDYTYGLPMGGTGTRRCWKNCYKCLFGKEIKIVDPERMRRRKPKDEEL